MGAGVDRLQVAASRGRGANWRQGANARAWSPPTYRSVGVA
jgi:hypothetical protein